MHSVKEGMEEQRKGISTIRQILTRQMDHKLLQNEEPPRLSLEQLQ